MEGEALAFEDGDALKEGVAVPGAASFGADDCQTFFNAVRFKESLCEFVFYVVLVFALFAHALSKLHREGLVIEVFRELGAYLFAEFFVLRFANKLGAEFVARWLIAFEIFFCIGAQFFFVVIIGDFAIVALLNVFGAGYRGARWAIGFFVS